MCAVFGISLYNFFSIFSTLLSGLPSLLSYKEYNNSLSLFINTSFVVVEPASIPTKQSPLNSDRLCLGTLFLSCRFINSL